MWKTKWIKKDTVVWIVEQLESLVVDLQDYKITPKPKFTDKQKETYDLIHNQINIAQWVSKEKYYFSGPITDIY